MNDKANSIAEPAMLAATGVAKRFGSTRALIDADFEVRRGEVHGLLGANGAGKSTLSRIICGHIRRDSGDILYNEKPLNPRSTRDALRSGIALVAQETSLAPDLSVLENIFLPEYGTSGRLSYGSMRQRAHAILSRLGHEQVLPLDQIVRDLSAAQRQLVEIAKALALEASLMIFDEPTSSLSPSEVSRLFDIMSRLKEQGHGLVFVSHRLEEVFAVTDRVTIMREGATVARNLETATLTQSDIIRHMVGRDLESIYGQRDETENNRFGETILEVEHLVSHPIVHDVSFSVRKGEVLGLGGLVGAGRSEAVGALFGLRHRDGGTIKINGKQVEPRSPAQAIKLGIGLVAEDRRAQNIVPDLTVGENLYLAHIGSHKGFTLGYSSRRKMVDELLSKLDLPKDRLDAGLLTFSGGMQQKVIIARWLLVEPSILILDEPTKGVDIGTRSSIYSILREIADQGVAIIVISSDFEELLGVCDRVVVMSDGMTIADLPKSVLNEEKLTLLAAPRTSTQRNMQLLKKLSDEYNASTFWALIDTDELICLGTSSGKSAPQTGLTAGNAFPHEETKISYALNQQSDDFIREPESGIATLLVPMRNKRGHDLGWIGVSINPDAPLPDRQQIISQISDMTDADLSSGAS